MISRRTLYGFIVIIMTLPLMGQSCELADLFCGTGYWPVGTVVWGPNFIEIHGKHHSLKIEDYDNGTLKYYGKGLNDSGQLGRGYTTPTGEEKEYNVEIVFPGNIPSKLNAFLGHFHSMVIGSDGKVYAWGKNDKGQLGIGTSVPYVTVPTLVDGYYHVQKFASGANHCLTSSIAENEYVIYTWGDNSCGQLGVGNDLTGDFSDIPVAMHRPWPQYRAINQLAAGRDFSLILLDDGTVWACGKVPSMLGNKIEPVPIPGQNDVAEISAGDNYYTIRTKRGLCYTARSEESAAPSAWPGQLAKADGTALTGVLSISSGSDFSMALLNGGTVWTWGDNSKGQLGDGTTTPRNYWAPVPGLSGVKAIQAGGAVARATRGDYWPLAWGDNSCGQLNDGTSQNYRPTPTPMNPQALGISLGNVGKVLSAGCYQSLVLQNSGQALGWGGNQYGQLGDGTTTNRSLPVPVNFSGTFTSVATGWSHSLGLDGNGAIWGWGLDNYLGIGAWSNTPITLPRLISDPAAVQLPTVSAVATRCDHSLALGTDGTVWGWGSNMSGQLGSGLGIGWGYYPVMVEGLPSATAIAAGADERGFGHSLVLGSDGKVYALGLNDTGQLGDGTQENRTDPVQVSNLDNVAAIAAGGDLYTMIGGQQISNGFSLALKNDGTVWAWGKNHCGQLGDGSTTTPRLTPVQVANLTNVVAITGGDRHALALKQDGTVWGWGLNAGYALGNGVPLDSTNSTPVQVAGLSDVAAISAHADLSLAVDNSGSVWRWGRHPYLTPESTPPVQIPDSTGNLLGLVMPAPVANAPLNVTSTGFTANWNAYTGAVTYYLDVATDAGFTNFVPGYMSLSVGNVTQKDVTGLDPKIPYYCRIAAQLDGKVSPASNTVVRFPTAGSPIAIPTLLLLLSD